MAYKVGYSFSPQGTDYCKTEGSQKPSILEPIYRYFRSRTAVPPDKVPVSIERASSSKLNDGEKDEYASTTESKGCLSKIKSMFFYMLSFCCCGSRKPIEENEILAPRLTMGTSLDSLEDKVPVAEEL